MANKSSLPAKTLLLIDGRKGGTGKSMCSMAVLEYLSTAGVPGVQSFDLDGDTGDLAIRYGAIGIEATSSDLDALGQILDVLLDPEGDVNVAVVDVGARTGALFDRFLTEALPGAMALDVRLQIGCLWVVGGSQRSLTYLSEASDRWRASKLSIDTTIVANEGVAQQFDFIEHSATGKAILAGGVAVTHLPRMDEAAAREPESLQLGFGAYTTTTRHGKAVVSISRRATVYTWITRCAIMFDTIPFLASLTRHYAAKAPNAVGQQESAAA